MTIVPIHVLAGVIAIVAGYVALFAVKGARVHRRSGAIFAGAMLVMSLSAVVIAVGRPGAPVNIPAGLVTAYLIATGFAAVQTPSPGLRAFERAAMVAAFLFAGVSLTIAMSGTQGPFTAPVLMFGAVALFAANGDRRMLRAGGLQGAPRLKRHLWRMCTGLFIAAGSFFLGPPSRVPEPLRLPPFRLIPLVALAAMAYWLWRYRHPRISRATTVVRAPEAI